MSRPPKPVSVTLKLATSLDGRIAAAGGAARWITGEPAREQAHRLRAAHDAVLVGAGTARADDPDLRVRLTGYDGPQPVRAVLDPRLTLRPDSRLAQSAREAAVIAFAAPERSDAALEDIGIIIENIEINENRLDLNQALARLAARDVASVMVEGGGRTAAAFLRAGLVDRIELFRAPILIGGDGVAAVGEIGVTSPDHAPRFVLESVTALGDDLWERYVPLAQEA
jgi:diaminohydroxyphosphoribosylaminopyrimidine deaminase/5-amino-6-(5-phosphoribosylamino)uracil reductase